MTCPNCHKSMGKAKHVCQNCGCDVEQYKREAKR